RVVPRKLPPRPRAAAERRGYDPAAELDAQRRRGPQGEVGPLYTGAAAALAGAGQAGGRLAPGTGERQPGYGPLLTFEARRCPL
ncbi:hypothetical protein THAOC_28451, partial [Thalassiosira oceanica]